MTDRLLARGWPRSWLFVPASDDRKLKSALRSDAGAVIADLEDSVAAGEKDAARSKAVAFASTPTAKWRVVRINDPLCAAGEEDLRALSRLRLDAIMVPKATLDSVQPALSVSQRVVALVETAQGVKDAERMAAAPGVIAVALGTVDLAAQLGLQRIQDGLELLYVRSRLVVECAAADVPAIDGVFEDLRDLTGLDAEARRARALGFSAKLCVHPGQVHTIHRAFAPSEDEISWAKCVIDAYDRAERRGEGAVKLDDQLVDLATVRVALKTLSRESEGDGAASQ